MKIAAIAALMLATALPAAAQQLKPDRQIQLRQAAYRLMGYNFGSLNAMVQDKKPYNKEEAGRNADFVAMLSEVPKDFFGPGTEAGAPTDAKPDIWKNRSDFDAKMNRMIEEAKKLPQAARTDLAALKKAVGDAGAACKACHDEYKNK